MFKTIFILQVLHGTQLIIINFHSMSSRERWIRVLMIAGIIHSGKNNYIKTKKTSSMLSRTKSREDRSTQITLQFLDKLAEINPTQ